jgi:hydrogenase maturation protease
MRTVIIGYGNPLRSDDALGWRVTERLRELVTDSDVEILSLHQLTPELMDTVSRVERAIFIDACAEGAPGDVVERSVKPEPATASFTHHATPEAILAGARELYGHAPNAVMLSVAGADFSLGSELSEVVSARVEEVVGMAMNALRTQHLPALDGDSSDS